MTRKWFGPLIVAGMAVFSILVLPALPAEIPVHWNLAGDPDSTMSKALGAFLMVLVGVGVWRRTHRLGGYACAFAGLLMVATGFLPHPARLWVSALAFLAMVMIPVAYSYVIWRDLGEDRVG